MHVLLYQSMLAMIRDLVVENHKLLDDGTSESACISAETAKRVVAKSEEISTVSAAGHTVSLQRHELERGLMETHLRNNDKHMQKLHANRSDSKKEFTVIRDASDKIRIGVNESANRIVSDIKCEVQLGTTTGRLTTLKLNFINAQFC